MITYLTIALMSMGAFGILAWVIYHMITQPVADKGVRRDRR